MKLQEVPAARGAAWLRQGLSVFAHRPLAFSALFAIYLFVALGVMILPLLGPMLVLCSLPLVTLAFMIATQQTLQGGSPAPSVFVLPLRITRARTFALVKLGLLYTAASVLIMLLGHWFDGGKLVALMTAGDVTQEEFLRMLQDPQLRQGIYARLLLSLVLSLPFWYAPALVHWGGHTAAKSLFFSTIAVWRNKRAFVVYGAVWFGGLFLCGVVCSMIFAAIGQPQWAELILMPVGLMFFTVMYASLFFTFIDSFEMTMDSPEA